MPTLETGEHVEVLFNTLGVINRLNSMQLYEQSVTFIGNRIMEQVVKDELDIDYRIDLVLDIIKRFNKRQHEELLKYLEGSDYQGKLRFIDSLKETGIVMHLQPMWEEEPIFDVLKSIYQDEKYSFIKPYKVYVNRFGRKIKMRRDLVVGDMYIMRLKQSSEKGFSARSTGSINKLGFPDRPSNNKNDLYSKNPVRIGIQENNNVIIGVDPKIVAKLHMFHRNSQMARQDISKALASQGRIEEKSADGYINRNATILNAELKLLGLRLEDDTKDYMQIYAPDLVYNEDYKGRMIISTEGDREELELDINAEEELKKEPFIGTPEEFVERHKRKVDELRIAGGTKE